MSYQIQAGNELENFETIGDWTVTGGTAAVDTNIKRVGAGSLKLTSGSGTNCIATKTINLDLSLGGLLYFWVFVENADDVASLQVVLANDSAFSNFFSKIITAEVHNGWNKIAIGRTRWSATGAPSWQSNMVRLRVRVNANASVSPIVYFNSMYYGFYSRPKIILSFDDGWDTQYSAGYPYLRSKGLKGTCYIIQARIGVSLYMTLANLYELHDAGWDMANHTVNHNNMTAYSYAQAYPEIKGCADYLAALGFTRRNEHLHLAYPNGGYNADVLAAMAASGMITGRTIIDRPQANEIDAQYMITRQVHVYTASAATYLGYVNRAVEEGGCTQINYHKIVADGAGAFDTEVEISQFQGLVDYVAKLDKARVLDCVTLTEWYEGLTEDRKVATIYA